MRYGMQHVSSASDSERNVNTHWPDGPGLQYVRSRWWACLGWNYLILNKGLKMSVWVKVSMLSPVINVLSLSLPYPRRGTKALMLLVSQNDAIWCNNYIVSIVCLLFTMLCLKQLPRKPSVSHLWWHIEEKAQLVMTHGNYHVLHWCNLSHINRGQDFSGPFY